jgi:hypothetical protein
MGGSTGTGGGGQDASVADAGKDAVAVHDGSVTDAGAYVRTAWTAQYTCTGGPCPPMSMSPNDLPKNAFDGTLATRWSTGMFQSALDMAPTKFPLFFTIDMGQVMNISKITMHPGCQDSLDSPATVEVFLSTEGTSLANAVFGTSVGAPHMVPGGVALCNGNPPATAANGLDTITFTQAPARFIQLKGTRRVTPDKFWAIGELNVYP